MTQPNSTAQSFSKVVEAARAFVETTSVFRQRKESREEFEALARALIEAGAFTPDGMTGGR